MAGLPDEENEFQDYLREIGQEWFIKHDCLDDSLKNFLLMCKDRAQTENLLSMKKAEIERFVERTKLPTSTTPRKSNEPLRCVLIGKTGDGKSSLGNILINGEPFSVGRGTSSKTKTIQPGFSDELEIIDTPGFGDPNVTIDPEMELTKTFHQFDSGIHAFIHVLSVGNPRLSQEDVDIFEKINTMFGEKMKSHTVLVLTNADVRFKNEKHGSMEAYITESKNSDMGKVLRIIGEQVIAVNASAQGYQRELHREDILNLIRQVVHNAIVTGNGECYTHEVFTRVQKELADKKMRRRREILRRKEGKEAIAKLETTVRMHVCSFISDKTRSHLADCKSNLLMREGHVSLIVKLVKTGLGEYCDIVGHDEVYETVCESFDDSIERVNNATFMEKVSMAFSFLFGKEYTKDLMGKYVTV